MTKSVHRYTQKRHFKSIKAHKYSYLSKTHSQPSINLQTLQSHPSSSTTFAEKIGTVDKQSEDTRWRLKPIDANGHKNIGDQWRRRWKVWNL